MSGLRYAEFIFQSTPPVKAATIRNAAFLKFVRISIHAAREGGDGFGFCPCLRAERFQSTPPVKAATGRDMRKVPAKGFQSTPPVKAATL